MKDKESGREGVDARGGNVPEAFADPWELNVPELSNGAAVHRISNQAADKESGLLVQTGASSVLTALLYYFYKFCTGTVLVDPHLCKCAGVIHVDSFQLLTLGQMLNYPLK